MAFFPTNTGGLLEGMNIFAAKPSEALTGILTPEQQDKLNNQALFQGGLGTIITYLAQPKNQGYGSVLPYLGKAYLGGMQQSQGAYDAALKSKMDSLTMAKNMRELEMSGITDVQKLLKAKNELNPSSPTYQGDLTALDAAITKLTHVSNPDKLPTSAEEYNLAIKDPAYMKFLREKWDAENKARRAEIATEEANYKFGTPQQSFSVTAGGKTYYFKDQNSANLFRQKAGIK